MTNYSKNSFTHLKREDIIKECLEGIRVSGGDGQPKNFCVVHAYAGSHEEIVSEFIPTLEEAVDSFLSTLNDSEWDDDSCYLSIEGNWNDEDGDDDEIGILMTIYAEELNEMEVSD